MYAFEFAQTFDSVIVIAVFVHPFAHANGKGEGVIIQASFLDEFFVHPKMNEHSAYPELGDFGDVFVNIGVVVVASAHSVLLLYGSHYADGCDGLCRIGFVRV